MSNSMPSSAKRIFLRGDILGLTDVFKIILLQPGFVFDPAAHHVYADVIGSEVADGFGYSVGGQLLTEAAIAVDDGAMSATLAWKFIQWFVSGGTISFSGAIIYDDTTDTVSGHDYTDAVVSYIDAGGTQAAVNGKIIELFNIFAKFV